VEPRDNDYLHPEDEVHPIEAPDGLDLHPQPRKAVRISKRATVIIISIIALLLIGFAYGGYQRTLMQEATARQAGVPKGVAPATQAGNELLRAIPQGSAPLATINSSELQPPGSASASLSGAPCAADPKTGQAYRYDPQTGQPCNGLPQERVVVRREPPLVKTQPEPTADERRIIAAYQREQEAMVSPTDIRASSAGSQFGTSVAPQANQLGRSDISSIAALSPSPGPRTVAVPNPPVAESEYDGQNMQARKEAFLATVGSRQTDDYLSSTRGAALSRYEIKAGWEIPAVLEQSLNSDLPGELKALVTSNVYDTATGLYLLIPQGSRLIGKYDSRVAYGQDGVQVAWSRVIYPDASSIDLDGMVGADSQGNAGLRDKVDRHYRRPTLSSPYRLLRADQHVYRGLQHFAAAERKRAGVSDSQSNCSERGWSGTEPDRRPDYATEPECPANDQGTGGIQVQCSRKPRHPFRITVRACALDCSRAFTNPERRSPMSTSEFARRVVSMVELDLDSRPAAIEFEMAYQARIAADRIRFAIRQIDGPARQCGQLREASLQLLDALDRLDSAERRFQVHSKLNIRGNGSATE
jgi:type IV secretory pathway VirB10-like protein